MDFVTRKKVALKMSFTLVDSLPLPKRFDATPVQKEIAKRVLRLAATGPELRAFWEEVAPAVDLDPFDDEPCEDEAERRELKSQLDVLVARDLFGLAEIEMRYVMDPTDVLGEDCGFETFGALKRAETKQHGRFLTKDLILQEWRDMQSPAAFVPAVEINLATLPDGAWTRPPGPINADEATAQLTAIMMKLSGPTAIWKVRSAFMCALEPKRLLRHLSTQDTKTWRRLVGQETTLTDAANLVAFAPKVDANWRAATNQLVGNRRIKEDFKAKTWAPGPGLDNVDVRGWPEGRAQFVLTALAHVSPEAITAGLPAEDQIWLDIRAA